MFENPFGPPKALSGAGTSLLCAEVQWYPSMLENHSVLVCSKQWATHSSAGAGTCLVCGTVFRHVGKKHSVFLFVVV